MNGLAASPAGQITGGIPYPSPVTVTFTPATGTPSTTTALYAGVAFAGGFQVNATVPKELKSGDYKVSISTQNTNSPAGPIIPVGP